MFFSFSGLCVRLLSLPIPVSAHLMQEASHDLVPAWLSLLLVVIMVSFGSSWAFLCSPVVLLSRSLGNQDGAYEMGGGEGVGQLLLKRSKSRYLTHTHTLSICGN